MSAQSVVGNDNTVRLQGLSLQIPADRHRHHYVKARLRVDECTDGNLAVFDGPRCPFRYRENAEPIVSSEGQAA